MSDPRTLKGFSDAEEAFFRAGIAASKPEPVETFADLDVGYPRHPVLQKLFGRRRPETQ